MIDKQSVIDKQSRSLEDVFNRIEKLQQLAEDLGRKVKERLEFADENCYAKMVCEVASAFGSSDRLGLRHTYTCELINERGRKTVCKFTRIPAVSGEYVCVEVKKGLFRWEPVFEGYMPQDSSTGRATLYKPGKWELVLFAVHPLAKERLLEKKVKELAEQLGAHNPASLIL